MGKEVHLILKKLGTTSKGEKIVGHEALALLQEAVDTLHFRGSVFFGNSRDPRHR
jgi:hypothetical protein